MLSVLKSDELGPNYFILIIVYSMEELLLDLEEGQDILINLQVKGVEDTAVILVLSEM